MKKYITIVIIIINTLLITSTYSQITNSSNISSTSTPLTQYVGWDGSFGSTAQNLDIANQFTPAIGTNYSINFWTNSTSPTQKMTILGTTGADDGFAGIGLSFTSPVAQLHLSTMNNTGTSAGELFRTDAPSGYDHHWYMFTNSAEKFRVENPLAHANDIRLMGMAAGEMDFYTNGNHCLRIDHGTMNLDVINASSGYEIGDPTLATPTNHIVLWHKGYTTDIFVGVNAGTNTTGPNNSFVGSNAGNANTGGHENTAVGSEALKSNNNGHDITAIGYQALTNYNQIGVGYELTAVGSGALYVLPNGGFQNTAVGCNSLYSCTSSGEENTAVGHEAMMGNTSGSNNTGVGDDALLGNVSGSYNTGLGSETVLSSFGLNNATAIGAKAVVTNNDQMILGGIWTVSGNYHSTFVGIGLSGNVNGPRNSLEINADPNRVPPSSATATGLRFTQVNQSISNNAFGQPFRKTTIPAWGKVLTVDANGDVGLTDDAGFGGIPLVQNAINTNTAGNHLEWGSGDGTSSIGYTPLLHNTEVQMDDFTNTPGVGFSVYYSGQAFNSGNPPTNPLDVGIGYDPIGTPTLQAKLDVYNQTQAWSASAPYTNLYAGRFIEDGTYNLFQGSAVDFTGVYGESRVVTADNKANNFGGDFLAQNAVNFNTGVRGTAIPGGAASFGVLGIVNIGAMTPPPGINFAVFGDLGVAVAPCLGPWPPGCTAPNFAGYFNGDVLATKGMWALSDASLKQNVQNLQNPMSIINQLNPKSFTFDQTGHASMQLPDGPHYGLIAQDIENILPTLVKDAVHPARYDSLGNETFAAINYKCVNYTELIPFAIGAIKQQQANIDDLNQRLAALEATVAGCCAQNRPSQNNEEQNQNVSNPTTYIDLVSQDAILYQNTPNPFGSETIIHYYLPQSVTNAKIIFLDEYGQVIKETELTDRGNASVVVNSANLANGIYSYSLIVNGNVKDTKKMIRSK